MLTPNTKGHRIRFFYPIERLQPHQPQAAGLSRCSESRQIHGESTDTNHPTTPLGSMTSRLTRKQRKTESRKEGDEERFGCSRYRRRDLPTNRATPGEWRASEETKNAIRDWRFRTRRVDRGERERERARAPVCVFFSGELKLESRRKPDFKWLFWRPNFSVNDWFWFRTSQAVPASAKGDSPTVQTVVSRW